MDWIWTDHIIYQLKDRKIPRILINDVLEHPDEIKKGKNDRFIYQKKVDSKLLRVVVVENRLITVYLTKKFKKYSGGK